MTYKLKSLESVWLFRDHLKPGQLNTAELRAQVASQDYFALLATRLDLVAQSLEKTDCTDYAVLEETIKQLLYLHQNYTIQKLA